MKITITYVVELKTKPTFTTRKIFNRPQDAQAHITKLLKENTKEGYNKYSNIKKEQTL